MPTFQVLTGDYDVKVDAENLDAAFVSVLSSARLDKCSEIIFGFEIERGEDAGLCGLTERYLPNSGYEDIGFSKDDSLWRRKLTDKDLRSPLKKAWDEFLLSEHGKKCSNIETLTEEKYLVNRLSWAFNAGVSAQKKIQKATEAPPPKESATKVEPTAIKENMQPLINMGEEKSYKAFRTKKPRSPQSPEAKDQIVSKEVRKVTLKRTPWEWAKIVESARRK